MSKRSFFSHLLLVILLILSCNQNQAIAQRITKEDSLSALNAFEQLKTNSKFLKELGLTYDKHYRFNEILQRPFFGDLNNDGNRDVMIGFVIEGRGGGNRFDVHYAIFFKLKNKWKYQSQFDANAGSPDFFYGFNEISYGLIIGAIVDNQEVLADIPVEFTFKNNTFIKTYTALHKGEKMDWEYILFENILTYDEKFIPIEGKLRDYEKLYGKGTIETPNIQPECGTYFDESTIKYGHFPFLNVEINNRNEAFVWAIQIKDSGCKIQTDKGTITESTSLNELKSVFYNQDKLFIYYEEGNTYLRISACEECDGDFWDFKFDKNGVLQSVAHFVPC